MSSITSGTAFHRHLHDVGIVGITEPSCGCAVHFQKKMDAARSARPVFRLGAAGAAPPRPMFIDARPAAFGRLFRFFFLFSVAVVAVIVVVVIPHLLFFSSLDKHSARPGRSFFSLSLSCSSFFSDVEVNQSSEFSKKIRALCS